MKKRYELEAPLSYKHNEEDYRELLDLVREQYPSFHSSKVRWSGSINGFSYKKEERDELIKVIEAYGIPLSTHWRMPKPYYAICNRSEDEMLDFEKADLFCPSTNCDTGLSYDPEQYEDSLLYQKSRIKGFKYFTNIVGGALILTKEGKSLMEQGAFKGVKFRPLYEKDRKGKITVSKKLSLLLPEAPVKLCSSYTLEKDAEGFDGYPTFPREIIKPHSDFDVFPIASKENQLPTLYFSKKFYDFVNNSPLHEDLTPDEVSHKFSWSYYYLK